MRRAPPPIRMDDRLFSFISLTWTGQPLVSYHAIVTLISATRTRSRLAVKAVLDTRDHDLGRAVTAEEVTTLHL